MVLSFKNASEHIRTSSFLKNVFINASKSIRFLDTLLILTWYSALIQNDVIFAKKLSKY